MSKSVRNWLVAVAAIVAVLILFLFLGQSKSSSQTVKIGITGSDDRIWKAVTKKVKKEGFKIKIVEFSDYSQPNAALDQGEVDLNAFQTRTFMDDWNKTHHTNIVSIGTTAIAPMALYSKKISQIDQFKTGDKIIIPNDATNEGRALQPLQNAGLIKLKKTKLPTVKDVTSNPKKLDISEVDAAQTARSLDDVTASVINSGVASDSHLNPKTAVYKEKITKESKPYVNVISANKKDRNNAAYKKIVKAYQSKDIEKLIKKYYGDFEAPAWNYKILQ